MTHKDELLSEIEETRERFLYFLESIPEAEYARPSDNPAWTVGDVLYHVTLGPWALAFELWVFVHAHGLFQFAMKIFPSRLFNRVNAWFARKDARRLERAEMAKTYERGHARLRAVLEKVREKDLSKSVTYPAEFVSELAGEVNVERLVHYVTGHFELHAAQIQRARENVSV
ncbi:MAG: DinB family protein [Chloroflexota bacterium]